MSEIPSRKTNGYRPEIDGLRAIAVLAVVFYHANPGTGGGFAGVDVFFVISGYLINGLLLKHYGQGGGFDPVGFWERRIRRIFPALAVVAFASLAAGWFLLLPADYKELGQSASALALFCPNFFFWARTGYFDGLAGVKVLLHTWSLGVEEQFYIVFPLLMAVLCRWRRGVSAAVLGALCAVSFALSVYCMRDHARAAFYLPFSRAWELGIGALLAMRRNPGEYSAWLCELTGAAGLGAVLYVFCCYDASTPLPGVAALAPCLGAALFIESNTRRVNIAGRLLSLPPLVFTGLLSYSLYLWHWPVLVFANYWATGPFPAATRAGLVGLSLALAFLSWKYVETPFRKRVVFPNRTSLFRFAGICATILLAAGVAIGRLDGVRSRLPGPVLAYADGRSDFDPVYNAEVTLEEARAGHFFALGSGKAGDPPGVLVWGDSHAMSVLPALDALCKQHSVRAFAATHSETPPLLDCIPDGGFSLKEETPAFARAVIGFVRANRIRNVILVARWNAYNAGRSAIFHAALAKTVAVLRASGARVWLMEEVPGFPWEVPKALAGAALLGQNPEALGLPLESYRAQLADQEREFSQMAWPGVAVLHPADGLVRGGIAPEGDGGAAIYRDSNHLTIHGALLLEPMFGPVFAQ